jgi:hypothetical protein
LTATSWAVSTATASEPCGSPDSSCSSVSLPPRSRLLSHASLRQRCPRLLLLLRLK